MKALFVLGVDQEDRPERWRAAHRVFASLATGLAGLGIDHHLYAHRASVKPKILQPGHYDFADVVALDELLRRADYTHAFIWGGRRLADRNIVATLSARNIRCIYGELGWFPQAGHAYFSQHGTNAECRLGDEGLAEHRLNPWALRWVRGRIVRSLVGLRDSFSVPALEGYARFDSSRPILLPLQDETDTNITLSSPLARMSDFVRLFAEKYPNQQFIARPHPSAPVALDARLPNVEIQDSAVNPFRRWRDYGGVIGINSTTLLQFSLLGLPVCGIGQGIGTGNRAYIDLDINNLPAGLESLSMDRADRRHFHDFLIRRKQLVTSKLSSPRYLRTTYIPAYFGIT
ncbi:MAG: hypothetical protein ACOY33_08590 [Pseudomonadota bacterium]